MRDMIKVAINNKLKFRYILMDTWFSAKENFEFIAKHEKDFIAALKSNRLFATSLEDKHNGDFISVSELELSDKQSIRGYVKGYENEVVIVRRIFTNKDASRGILNLVWFLYMVQLIINYYCNYHLPNERKGIKRNIK